MRRIVAVTAFAMASVTPALAACEDLLPQIPERHGPARPVAARDLALLRDIGQPSDRVDLESPLGLSPDGNRVAFVLRRADPAANAYCQGLIVLDLATGSPRLIDRGGDLIRDRYALFGHALPESGVPRVIVPRWSPDGRHIAYLKRDGPRAQIWLADAGGDGAKALSHAEAGVEELTWSTDGRHLVFSSRTGEISAEAALAQEALGGYLVDAQFRPLSARHPFAPNDGIATGYFAIDAATGETRPATDAERALLERVPATVPTEAIAAAAGSDGRIAWIARQSGDLLDRRLFVRANGVERACTACAGEIVDLWWSRAGPLFFVKREGTARQSLALYRWLPAGPSAPRRLMSTEDLIIGCRPTGRLDAICLREGSQMPRRIVRIEGETGRSMPVWNPNPDFDRLVKAHIERLFWSNANGIETFGDLVLPNGDAKAPYPLVIVQYGSRGFLRGGTGDEYPILALAARGHAVFSFQRPLHLSVRTGSRAATDPQDDPHAERRNVQSALERGLSLVMAKGVVDKDRIGITGLSDGATTVQWALLHGGALAAAAISSCCFDPGLIPLLGETQIDAYARDGVPRPGKAGTDFWSPISLSVNAEQIRTPILMNLSDDEFLGALDAYSALRTAGRPVEMHVFPGERHMKFQPAHRLAIYERNLQWFDFWLRNEESSPASLAPQYARWRVMRASSLNAAP